MDPDSAKFLDPDSVNPDPINSCLEIIFLFLKLYSICDALLCTWSHQKGTNYAE